MKMSPNCSSLSLYDIAGTPGVAADVGHVNTPGPVSPRGRGGKYRASRDLAADGFRPAPGRAAGQVKGFAGDDELAEALTGCDVVVIPAGVPRKPGMTRDDLFKINAGIVAGLTEACGKHCPEAMITMISNPVNSTVPIAAEVLKKLGVYDPKKLLGVTTLDVVRAKTFYAEKAGLDVNGVDVPVVGGHAGITILPLFSQATPVADLAPDVIDALTKRTMDGGTEVVQAKAGKGSATLSMAYAGALMADSCLRGLNGEPGVVECSYVESSVVPGLDFFSTKVKLGPSGVEEIMGIGDINEYEAKCLEEMKAELASSIKKGQDFVLNA